ncbi:MAG TPA: hypothetical protein VJJ52_03875 [Candidatus Nanoarchaeia archaeon]|nr:hypothetical protein [Candidatus Nanoarchaeia archaeon]
MNKKLIGIFAVIISVILLVAEGGNIISGLNTFYEFSKSVYTKIFHVNLHPTQPVYIVKTRIENLPIDVFPKLNDEDENYLIAYRLIDICGYMALQTALIPTNMEMLSMNSNFMRLGQENLTYSISTITGRRNGTITLDINSIGTKFEVQKQKASVEKLSENKKIEGVYEEIYKVDLSLISENPEALFDIVPEKDKEIKIRCLNTDNCKVIEMKFILSYIEEGGRIITLRGKDRYGEYYDILVQLPESNANKVSLYDLREGDKFTKISLENSTNATTYFSISPPPSCDKEGIIYLHT